MIKRGLVLGVFPDQAIIGIKKLVFRPRIFWLRNTLSMCVSKVILVMVRICSSVIDIKTTLLDS